MCAIEKQLVVELLFGIADFMENKAADEALDTVEELISGITRAITNRPNGLLVDTKLDYLLPILVDLAKFKEGFIKTGSLRTKFDQEGVKLRNKANTPRQDRFDPITALEKLLKLSAPDTVPLPPSPPPDVPSRQHTHFSLPTFLPPPVTKKVEREERTDTGYSSVMADSPDTTESATTSSTNSLLSSSSSYDGEDKSKFEVQQNKPTVLEGVLYTFPSDVTPYVINQLNAIAAYANCTMTIVKTPQGTCFFVNATKEWDRRKCIDNFNDFEKKYLSKRPPSRLSSTICTSPSLSPSKDGVRYDRSHLLQIKRNLRTTDESRDILDSLFSTGKRYDILM